MLLPHVGLVEGSHTVLSPLLAQVIQSLLLCSRLSLYASLSPYIQPPKTKSSSGTGCGVALILHLQPQPEDLPPS